MRTHHPLVFILAVGLGCGLVGCKDRSAAALKKTETADNNGAEEHIDPEEKAAAAKLRPAKDPIQEEIYAFRVAVRQAYNNRRFDELEQKAAELRAAKPIFGDGSWQIVQYYESFGCRDDEPENMWQLHERIHREWIAAKPASITAQVAYADFLTGYAWHARGSGYANSVTQEGWRLFRQRLGSARQALEESRELPEKDPVWWLTAMQVALGENMLKIPFDVLVNEATAFEPKLWNFDTARAYALLPRWQGEPGDWEIYAERAALRPNGLGAEAYARIALSLDGYYNNIFRETKASWPKTREGLAQLRQKYPDSLEMLSESALMATLAEDRALAREMFDQLGDRYLPYVWHNRPESFVHYRHWAQTGEW